MDYVTHDFKRDLMNKLKKGSIVKQANVDGERFVIEAFDYNSLRVGIKRIYANGNTGSKILWTNPEYIIPTTELGEAHNYCMHDEVNSSRMMIKSVIFNNPATIVLWSDGSKTVVKSHLDDYDPEKGLAMAIAKKALGNEGNYYNVFKKWLPNEDSSEEIQDRTCYEIAEKRFNKILDEIAKNYKIKNRRGSLENDKY